MQALFTKSSSLVLAFLVAKHSIESIWPSSRIILFAQVADFLAVLMLSDILLMLWVEHVHQIIVNFLFTDLAIVRGKTP